MKFLRVLLALTLLAVGCEAAEDLGIRSMFIGEQIMEVSDNRQITLKSDGAVAGAEISPDGKYAVYGIECKGKPEIRVTKSTGGNAVTLMDGPSEDAPPTQPPPSGEMWELDTDTDVYWSPDSSRFAFRAIHRTWDGDQSAEKRYIVVYAARGTFLKSIPAPEGGLFALVFGLVFGQDSRTLYVNAVLPNEDATAGQSRKTGIQALDTVTGSVQTIYTSDALDIQIRSSCDEGRSLLCAAYFKKGKQLKKIGLDGTAEDVTGDFSTFAHYSPDGTLAVLDGMGISIGNTQTQAKVQLIGDPRVLFERWAPNSKMLLYGQREKIDDALKQRAEEPSSLWLSLTAPGKLNSMCITLDHEGTPTCSRDSRRIAYINQGQLYVAELSLRDPTIPEKLAAGLPLTEDETKLVMQTNGKQIALGMMMYSADYDGNLPPADSLAATLYPYLRSKDVFLRPGGQDNVFSYVDPGVGKWSDIKRPSETVIGEMDAGYGWKVAVYADSHVEVKQK